MSATRTYLPSTYRASTSSLSSKNVRPIATACPYCISMFEDAKTALGMDDLRIADVVELAADALQE